jgi:hypothetical protein
MMPKFPTIVRFSLVIVLAFSGLGLWVPKSSAGQMFLPLILNTCSVAIPNGDFEQGRVLWIESSLHPLADYPMIVDQNYLNTYASGVTAHGGNWVGWLCGVDNEVSSIKQQLIVPAACPNLTYWHWIDSEADRGVHYGKVVLTQGNGPEVVVDSYDLCIDENTYGWVRHDVDLSAYAGQSVLLEIRAECQSTDFSSLFLDDVSFHSVEIQ